MGSPKFCGNSFSHRRAHNIEYMVLALPGILRLPTQMCTSLRIPSAAGILRDFEVRVRSSDLP